MKKLISFIFIFSIVSVINSFAQNKTDYSQYFSEKDLRSTVKYLSDDGCPKKEMQISF